MKLKRLFVLLMAFMAMTLCSGVVPAQEAEQKRRAQQVISRARAALGAEERLNAVKAFSVSWKFRRVAGNNDQDTGETQFDFLLPAKFLKKEVLNLSGELGQVTSLSVLSGETVWSDLSSSVADMPLVDEGVGSPEKQEAMRQGLKKELTLNLLQLMLLPPPSVPVELAYVGEAQAEDGKAHVIEAKAPNGFTVRLFIDQATDRLLMMSYREASTKVTLPAGQVVKTAAQTQYKQAAPSETEVRLRFADYRAEDGIMLPHLVIREKNGKVTQEAELKSFKINPSFKAEHFEATRKR